MPGTPCNSSNEVGKDLQPEDPQNVQRDEPTAPVREITQTDKLNKRLLVSFLQRMNSQETTDNQQSVNKNDEDDDDDEPTAPVHGITQTDKLNKRLLVSFLQRMNSQEATDNQQSANKNDEDDNDDESFE